jgi:hypothetical protein
MYLRVYYYKANTQFYFHEYRYVNKKNIRNDIVMLKVIYVERVTIGMCSLKIYIYLDQDVQSYACVTRGLFTCVCIFAVVLDTVQ